LQRLKPTTCKDSVAASKRGTRFAMTCDLQFSAHRRALA
jgi:hypothetical protein